MKKFITILTACFMVVSLAACGNDTQATVSSPAPQENESSSQAQTGASESATSLEQTSEPAAAGTNELVVYFSWSGNTETVANEIAEQTGADIFEITPQTPYSDDYDTVVDLAQQEQSGNARPEIANAIENIEDYDVIYVGFPNWWGDMPMILYTFFDSYDLSGKTIAPFCTSGGSGLSDTVAGIQALEPDATVTEGLHIRDHSVSDPANAVTEWLESIGLAE